MKRFTETISIQMTKSMYARLLEDAELAEMCPSAYARLIIQERFDSVDSKADHLDDENSSK